MKKYLIGLTAALCLLLTACGSLAKTEELSDEEVVNALVQAFRQGDYEGIKPYISDDNPLHQLFANTDEAVGGDLAPVYKACLEKAKDITCTAKAVEGKEAWGTVDVTMTAPNYYSAFHDAMAAALVEDVETGSGAFYDLPGWMAQALEGEGETLEESWQLHVGNRDGEMVMDTNTNREFFTALCGGLKSYLNASMTTCTFPDGTEWVLAAQGDEIVAIIRTESISGASQYAPEDLEAVIQAFEAPYETQDGLFAHGEVQGDLLVSRMGVDMETASSFTLVQMGLIDKQTTAGSNGHLSLSATISGFTRDGANCVTETFKPAQPET